jgi:hypothetical protein
MTVSFTPQERSQALYFPCLQCKHVHWPMFDWSNIVYYTFISITTRPNLEIFIMRRESFLVSAFPRPKYSFSCILFSTVTSVLTEITKTSRILYKTNSNLWKFSLNKAPHMFAPQSNRNMLESCHQNGPLVATGSIKPISLPSPH